MIANKLHGRKTKAGFYRRTADGKSEIYDWTTGTYRAPHAGEPESVKKAGRDLRALCEQPDAVGGYAWTVLSQVVSYAAAVAPDIADDVQAIDTAMCLGYNWGMGPFALADRVGVEWIAKRLAAEGRAVPALLAKAVERGGFYAKGILATDGETAPPTGQGGQLAPAFGGCRQAGARDLGCLAVGYRRRRRLPAAPHQDERPRAAGARCLGAGAGRRAATVPRAGDRQRGRARLLRWRQSQCDRRLGRRWRFRDAGEFPEARTRDVSPAQIRRLPGGCRRLRPHFGRRLRDGRCIATRSSPTRN